MSKLSKKMQELKRVIRLHSNWLVYATLGKSALSKTEIEELEAYGKLPMDRTLDLADKSYLLGRLRAILKRSEYKDVSFEEAEEKLLKMKLSPIEELVLEQARLKAGVALKGLVQEISDGAYDVLAQTLGAAVTEASVRQVVADETQLAIIYKKSAQELASSLAGRLQSTVKRDWKKVAQTELHRAKIAGQAQAIVNKVDIYAHSDGPDSKVSIIPAANCCEDCKEHYLDTSGNPKIFTLSDLIAAGSNGDPGVIHKKKKGIHIHWKTTLPPLHPNCGCQLVYIPSGYGWTSGKLGLLNKSLFDMSLRKANSTAGVSGGISSTVAPKGPPRPKPVTASAGVPSVPGAAAPGNVPGPGRPPGSGTATGGSTQQMSPCPFGGGSECVAHGGNGALEHKANGSVMKKHHEAMARGAQPKTEAAKEQQGQMFEAQAKQFNKQPSTPQRISDHLSDGEIGAVKVLGDEDHKGVSDSYKITIVGNGSGCMKPAFEFKDLTYEGFIPADGGPSMPKQSSHKSEVGAYQLATSLGLENHVPVTTLRYHDGSHGIDHYGETSVQHWQDDYGHIADIAPNAKGLSFIPPEHKETVVNKLKEIACLDIVMNNNDRHSGNLVFKEDLSDVKAIDHGMSFAAGMAGQKNSIHATLSKHTTEGLQVPDHLLTKFKNQSLAQTLRSLDGLTVWQKVQTHLRMKYLAHLQETHGNVPIEVTRYAGVYAQSYDPGSAARPHEKYKEFGMVPYRTPAGAGWELDDKARDEQVKTAMENWEMPDQLFARFVKSYANEEFGEISSDERLMLRYMKPAFKTGTGHELGPRGVHPEHQEAHQKYWDSIPAYAPMSHWASKPKEEEAPLRTPPTMDDTPGTAAASPKAKNVKEVDDTPGTAAASPKAFKKSLYLAAPSTRFPLT